MRPVMTAVDLAEAAALPETPNLDGAYPRLDRMREFDKLDEAEEIRELLRQVVRRPPADVTFAEETEQLLPELFGGLSVALARSFRVIDPKLTHPATEHWEQAFDIFRLVL